MNKIVLFLGILLLAVFLPVLFCVAFIGNHMDYFETLKLTTLLPNPVLFAVGAVGLVICVFLVLKCRKIRLTAKRNLLTDCVLAVLFLVVFFVNVRVAREIAFKLPWDVLVVREMAYHIAREQMLGYQYYLSEYSNNIPIAYILGKIYKKAMELKNYPYVTDFIWLQINCMLISAGGYFSCLLVKKLTGNLMATSIVFLLSAALTGISPWKIAPYTDTYGFVFPIMSIYFYVCCREQKKVWLKFLLLFLALGSGMAGGFVKPSIYIIPIAILIVEFLDFLTDYRKKWIFEVTGILLAAVMAFACREYKEYIIEEIGLDFNEEIEASWHHYFMMGLNEETTGGYYMVDAGIFGEFQTSKKARNEEEIARAVERLKERGVLGTAYFWLRKMVMTFNDGTFGWRGEVWVDSYYPEELASNTAMTERLREIFWPAGSNMGRYNTFCQLAWIFCLLGIPGICLGDKENRKKNVVLVMCFLGVFFYQLLFEARARYLFVFLPLLIACSVSGMQQYALLAENFVKRHLRDHEPDHERKSALLD